MRFTVKDIAKQCGLCPDTVRKHADEGRIPYRRDVNGWRIFTEESIDRARQLAGIPKQEPADALTSRVGK